MDINEFVESFDWDDRTEALVRISRRQRVLFFYNREKNRPDQVLKWFSDRLDRSLWLTDYLTIIGSRYQQLYNFNYISKYIHFYWCNLPESYIENFPEIHSRISTFNQYYTFNDYVF